MSPTSRPNQPSTARRRLIALAGAGLVASAALALAGGAATTPTPSTTSAPTTSTAPAASTQLTTAPTTAPATTTATSRPVDSRPSYGRDSRSSSSYGRDSRSSSSSSSSGRPSSASTATPAMSGGATSRPAFRDKYAVIADQNIFLKERRSSSAGGGRDVRPPSTSTTREAPPAPAPENSFLLTGIVLEDGTVHAYVEDMAASRIIRVAPGEVVARGTVTDISIDAIAYEANGQRTWITIGQTLSGVTLVPSGSTGGGGGIASSSTGPQPVPAGITPGMDPNDPSLTPEQRMKLRRLQQMGQLPPKPAQ